MVCALFYLLKREKTESKQKENRKYIEERERGLREMASISLKDY